MGEWITWQLRPFCTLSKHKNPLGLRRRHCRESGMRGLKNPRLLPPLPLPRQRQRRSFGTKATRHSQSLLYMSAFYSANLLAFFVTLSPIDGIAPLLPISWLEAALIPQFALTKDLKARNISHRLEIFLFYGDSVFHSPGTDAAPQFFRQLTSSHTELVDHKRLVS